MALIIRTKIRARMAQAAVTLVSLLILLQPLPEISPTRGVLWPVTRVGLETLLCYLPRVALVYCCGVFAFNLSSFEDQAWNATAPILFVVSVGLNLLDTQDAQGQFELISHLGYGILGLLSVVTIFLINMLLVREVPFDPNAIMSGKVCVLTGANCGIGLETAAALTKMGATVVLACRSEPKARIAMAVIKQRVSYAKLEFIPLDLSSRESIKSFVEQFNELKLPLHVLVNNGGVMMNSCRLNDDGVEMTIATNHLGSFLLTKLLLPKLLKHLHSRVVNVGSAMHYGVTKLDLKSLGSGEDFSMFEAYGTSKLCNLLFTKELDRRYSDRTLECFCVHPGTVTTNVHRNMPWLVGFLWETLGWLRMALAKSSREGAFSPVHAATSPKLQKHGGSFVVNCSETEGSLLSNDAELARKLWEWSDVKTSDFR
eukprot:m.70385 g.70385  ORF g.70385 m.70385 type:complete len:428 (-) comp24218_c0_seq1:64-1347(-)